VTGADPSPEACAAALTRLPGMGPARLVEILSDRDPCSAWAAILAGELTRQPSGAPRLIDCEDPIGGGAVAVSWSVAAARLDAEGWWGAAASRGVRVTWRGDQDYPASLAHDPRPPGVVFWRGSLSWLRSPCVAIVGTRSASPDGRSVAYHMGRELAAAGVCVVSGLALGIDGSAHRGALDAADRRAQLPGWAAPVGVAASGVDVPYPKRNADLWEQVASAGALISETPPGQPAQAWRFPTRNRIIAGLSQLVVVVESHETGGSLITVEAAIERGVEVRVVPGPVNSPSCAGSNQLLYDGAGPVRGARDVLDALGTVLPDPPDARSDSGRRGGERRRRFAGRDVSALGSTEHAVLSAVGWIPSTVNKVAERSAVAVTQVAMALEKLAAQGLVREDRGWWTRISESQR
jgi:DNA processing protein